MRTFRHSPINHLIVYLLIGLISSSSFATIYNYHPQSRLYLSGGYNPFRPTSGYLVCVDYDKVKPVDTQGAVSSLVDISMVSSVKDFYKKIDFSSSLAGSYLFAQGGASVNFFSEDTFHKDSLSWMILFKSDFGRYILENPRLKSKFKSMNERELVRSCGSEVVTEQRKGVMVYALFTLTNLTSSQKRKLETKFNFSAKGIGWNVKVESQYKSFMASALATSDMKAKVFALGGGGVVDMAGILSGSNEQFIDYLQIPRVLKKYIEKINTDQAAPTQYVTTHINAFRSDIEANQHLFKNRMVSELFMKYQDISSVVSRLRSTLYGDRSDQFNLSAEQESHLNDAYSSFEEGMNQVFHQASYCFDQDKLDLCKLPSLDLPNVKWPHLEVDYCENKRQKARDLGLLPDDLYEMAKSRNFIPVFEQVNGNVKVAGFQPCGL